MEIFIPLYRITGKNHFSIFIFPHRATLCIRLQTRAISIFSIASFRRTSADILTISQSVINSTVRKEVICLSKFMIPTKALPSRSLSSAKFLLSTYRFPSSPPTPPAQLPILFLSHYEKNPSVFPLHFPFFFHHSYFFLFTRSKSPDKTILLKVTVYPVLLQTRFSLIISYCLTNSNFTA